jgi:ABC-type branched-subunit amino acid transport system substrate-binding protein
MIVRSAVVFEDTPDSRALAAEVGAAFRGVLGSDAMFAAAVSDVSAAQICSSGALALLISASSSAVVSLATALGMVCPGQVVVCALPPSQPQDIIDELVRVNSSAVVYASGWLEHFQDESLQVAAAYRAAMANYEPLEPLSFTSFEGYLSARIVVDIAEHALRNFSWPLTRETFLRTAFHMGTIQLDGMAYGGLRNQTTAGFCNEFNMTMRVLHLSQRGADLEPLTDSKIASCGWHNWESESLGVVGATRPVRSTMLQTGRSTRRGAAAGIKSTGTEQLILVTLDDGFDPDKAAQNAKELEARCVAICSTVGAGPSQAVLDAIQNTTPYIGALSGGSALRTPFRRNVINLRASTYDEVFVLIQYLVHEKGCNTFALIYQDSIPGKDAFVATPKVLAALGKKLSISVPLMHNLSDTDEQIKLLASHGQVDGYIVVVARQAIPAIVAHIKHTFPGSVVAIGTWSGGEMFMPAYSKFNQSTENIFMTTVVPPTFESSTIPLVADFVAAVEPDFWTGSYLEDYLTGRFLAEIARQLKAAGHPITKKTILDHIYAKQTFNIGGITVGPFSDTPGSQCNQGSNRVYLCSIDEATSKLVHIPFYAQIPQCGTVFAEENGNDDRYLLVAILLATILPSLAFGIAIIAVAMAAYRYKQRQVDEL